jgi:hypothetical protein
MSSRGDPEEKVTDLRRVACEEVLQRVSPRPPLAKPATSWLVKGPTLEECLGQLPLPSAWKLENLKKYVCTLKDLHNRPEHLAILEKLFASGFALASYSVVPAQIIVVDYRCETTLAQLLDTKQFEFEITYLMTPDTHEKFETIGKDPVAMIDSLVIGKVEREREKCPICKTGFSVNQDVRYLHPCGHKYHRGCIISYQETRPGKCETCSR